MKLLKIMVAWVFSCYFTTQSLEPKKFVFVIPSYNNEKFYKENLDSIISQNYSEYRIIYCNDSSTDQTAQLVKKYIAANKLEPKFTYRENDFRLFALQNIYTMVHTCADDEIIVLIDGDDRLDNTEVLSYLNKLYSENDILMTYGNFRYASTGQTTSWVKAYDSHTIEQNTFREDTTTGIGHLRTFYAGLFKKIKEEDLKLNNEFLKSAYDVAILYPMIEMAGKRHKCIGKVLYIYNDLNPINNHKINHDLQKSMASYIMSKPKYRPFLDGEGSPILWTIAL